MKAVISIEEAVSKIKDGMVVMLGGFMAAGTPKAIVKALSQTPVKDLTIIVNDSAFPEKGVGLLISNKQLKKFIGSHIGTNPVTIEQYNNKEIEVEFIPQGTLAERIRAAGAGLGGILTPTGIGTIVENGKQKIEVDGKEYLLEKPLRADVALLGATKGDKAGNLYFRGTTQNLNPLMATAADLVIAEVEELVDPGEIEPGQVHTPGIFVDYLVLNNK